MKGFELDEKEPIREIYEQMKVCSEEVKARLEPTEGLMHKNSAGSSAKQIDLLLEQFEVLQDILEENPRSHE